MAFDIMYYITLACPTVQTSLEKLNQYYSHGVRSFQLDLPSGDPFGETDFVKKCMADALAECNDYGYYMECIREVRQKHPDIELSMVAYYDVIDAIGIEDYIHFLKEIGAVQNGIVGGRKEQFDALHEAGFLTGHGISYSDPEYELSQLQQTGISDEDYLYMRTKRKVETLNRKYTTWKQRVDLIRSYGFHQQIIAVADVVTKEDMEERRDAGVNRVIVGNVLMRLWDDEEALWKRLSEFQSTERN